MAQDAFPPRFGFKIPIGEVGTRVFQILETNIRLLAAHNHDGQNSHLIASTSVQNHSVDFGANDWQADASIGGYYQEKQVESTLDLDNANFQASYVETVVKDGVETEREIVFTPDVVVYADNVVRLEFNDNSKVITLRF